MKKPNRTLNCISIVILMLSCTALAFAASEKERMIKRAPQIKVLKATGVIGEKADGLLGFVKEIPTDNALVDAENKDRKTVYSEIAKKQGVHASAVAKRRAIQIAGQAASGDWLQGSDGKWNQK